MGSEIDLRVRVIYLPEPATREDLWERDTLMLFRECVEATNKVRGCVNGLDVDGDLHWKKVSQRRITWIRWKMSR